MLFNIEVYDYLDNRVKELEGVLEENQTTHENLLK